MVQHGAAKLVFFSQVPLKRHRRVNVSEIAGNDAEAEEASRESDGEEDAGKSDGEEPALPALAATGRQTASNSQKQELKARHASAPNYRRPSP